MLDVTNAMEITAIHLSLLIGRMNFFFIRRIPFCDSSFKKRKNNLINLRIKDL